MAIIRQLQWLYNFRGYLAFFILYPLDFMNGQVIELQSDIVLPLGQFPQNRQTLRRQAKRIRLIERLGVNRTSVRIALPGSQLFFDRLKWPFGLNRCHKALRHNPLQSFVAYRGGRGNSIGLKVQRHKRLNVAQRLKIQIRPQRRRTLKSLKNLNNWFISGFINPAKSKYLNAVNS